MTFRPSRNLNVAIVLMAVGWVVLSAEVPDIGVISPRRAMTLGENTTRPDFVSFTVEVRSEASPTNFITFTLTNTVLTVMDMARVPSGPGIIGVKANYADGEESEMVVGRYDLRRGRPPGPSIEATHPEGSGQRKRTLSDEIWKIRGQRRIPVPPLPGQMTTNTVWRPGDRPLTGGTNRDYGQHLDGLADRSSKRRSE